jgi:hypothetical protein
MIESQVSERFELQRQLARIRCFTPHHLSCCYLHTPFAPPPLLPLPLLHHHPLPVTQAGRHRRHEHAPVGPPVAQSGGSRRVKE